MSFQPVLPLDGYVGWRFLQRTLDAQTNAHANAPAAQRDETYVRENIGKIQTAEDLVSDRRLLRVALTAFGLADDLPNRAYIEKVLESSTSESGSFVNRLTDKRYHKLAEAFGFGDEAISRNQAPGFADGLIQKFQDRSFEIAVGDQSETMRMALSLDRDLGDLAAQGTSEGRNGIPLSARQALGQSLRRRIYCHPALGRWISISKWTSCENAPRASREAIRFRSSLIRRIWKPSPGALFWPTRYNNSNLRAGVVPL